MTLRTQILLSRIKDRFNSIFKVLIRFLSPKNKGLILVLFLFLVAGIFVYGYFTYANALDGVSSLSDAIMKMISYLLYLLAYGLGWIAMKIFLLVVMISGYNDFVISPAVTKGWVIIRDVCNMLIVLFLLFYAFAVIIRLPGYSENKLLPRLLIAAVLINFSKLMCGVMIDLAQVFMMTFVNGYAATAGANLINGLHLESVLVFDSDTSMVTDWVAVARDLLFVIFFLAATLIIIVLICAYLAVRVAVLWILVVLSPLGFLGISHFPKIKEYTDKWWSNFFNYLLVGPILAFFLWLTFLVMSNPQENIDSSGRFNSISEEQRKASGAVAGGERASEIEMTGSVDILGQSAIALAMLYGAYWIAKTLSGITAGALMSYAKSTARYAAKVPGVGAVRRRVGAYRALVRGKKEARRKEKAEKFAEKWYARRSKVTKVPKKMYGAAKGAVGAGVGVLKEQAKFMVGRGEAASRYKQARNQTREKGGTWWQSVKAGFSAADDVQKSRAMNKIKKEMHYAGSVEDGFFAETEKKNIQNHKDNFDARGLESKDLAEIARASEDPEERMAALQKLMVSGALAENFKGDEGQKELQGIISRVKDSVTSLTGRDFNNEIKGKYAHLAYDLKTDKGKQQFQQALLNGDFDISKQDRSFYESKEALSLSQETLGNKPYEKAMTQAANRDKNTRDAIIKTTVDHNFKHEIKGADGKVDMEKTNNFQKTNKKIVANITGNLKQAYDTEKPQNADDDKKNIVGYLNSAGTSQWAGLDMDDENLSAVVKSAIAEAGSAAKLQNLMNKGETEIAEKIGKIMMEFKDNEQVRANLEQIAAHPSLSQTSEFAEIVKEFSKQAAAQSPAPEPAPAPTFNAGAKIQWTTKKNEQRQGTVVGSSTKPGEIIIEYTDARGTKRQTSVSASKLNSL